MRGPLRVFAVRRLKRYLETRPKGVFKFQDFADVAGPRALLYEDVLETMAPYILAGSLQQFVIVDNDSSKEYSDICAVPDELEGEPMLLDRLQLMYRFP